MKISVVTISFNQADFIAKCIESVLTQGNENIEYIIVDPGSTDGSREIIARYTDRLSKVVFEPDNGPADGLNKGFAQATGDVLCYVNADDILLPGALLKVIELFTQKPETDVLIGNGFQLARSGQTVRKLFSSRWSIKAYVYGVANVVQQATFFRREVFVKAGGFNSENRTCWDGELLVDMDLAGARFVRTDVFLGGFRIYEESISGSGRLNDKYERDCRRIRVKILGREWNQVDSLLCWLFRVGKYFNHPSHVFQKLQYKLKKI